MNPPANAAAISAKAAKMRNGRARKVFIPITDEILFERPELITSPLRPYQVDHPCFHWLAVEVETVETPCAYTPVGMLGQQFAVGARLRHLFCSRKLTP